MTLSAALPIPSNSLCPRYTLLRKATAFLLRFRFGGYATYAPPLAAVAARGAVEYITDFNRGFCRFSLNADGHSSILYYMLILFVYVL